MYLLTCTILVPAWKILKLSLPKKYIIRPSFIEICDLIILLLLSHFVNVTSYLQNKTAQLATNEEEALGKAYLKYLDALANGNDNHVYNLHVGRMLLLQGKPEEAVIRLQVAVGLKPTNTDVRSVHWTVRLNNEAISKPSNCKSTITCNCNS